MPDPPIDLSTLDRLFKGDRQHMVKWIQLYLEEAPGYFAKLETCLANDDATGLSASAHEMRPQAHYLGSTRMLELLILIGQRANAEGTQACAGPVAELLALDQKITAELKVELPRS